LYFICVVSSIEFTIFTTAVCVIGLQNSFLMACPTGFGNHSKRHLFRTIDPVYAFFTLSFLQASIKIHVLKPMLELLWVEKLVIFKVVLKD